MKNIEFLIKTIIILIVVVFPVAAVSAQEMSQEERIVRLAYMKLATYNRASGLERASVRREAYTPEDNLRFRISDFHTGPIEEINDSPLSKNVTKPSGKIIQIIRQGRSGEGLPEHAMYHAYWKDAPYIPEDWDALTLKELLSRDIVRFADIGKYTSYSVTVSLTGQERTYKALVLYHEQLQSTKQVKPLFFDNIIGPSALADALSERSHPVRSPWNEYARAFRHRRNLTNGAINEDNLSTEEQSLPSSRSTESHSLPPGLTRSSSGSDEEEGTIQPAVLCPPGTIMEDGFPGWCCDSLSMTCCLPYDPTTGWCDAATCEYPNCNQQQPPPPPPPPPNCIVRTDAAPPIFSSSPNFTNDHVKGGHGAWAQSQGKCIYDETCFVTCRVEWYGDPPYKSTESGRTWFFWHVEKLRIDERTDQIQQGGSGQIACGAIYAIAWDYCVTPWCSVALEVEWTGSKFQISNSSAWNTWQFNPNLSCYSTAP